MRSKLAHLNLVEPPWPRSVGPSEHEIALKRTQVREEVPGDGEQRLALPAQPHLLLQGQGGAQRAPDDPATEGDGEMHTGGSKKTHFSIAVKCLNFESISV